MNPLRYPFAFCLLACLPLTVLPADVVLLRNGARVEGKIIGQSRTNVRIRNAGGVRNIPRGTIRRIVFGAFDANAARKAAEERRKQQQELIKKQQEAFKKQQEAVLKKQQEERLKQQYDEFEKQEEAKREAALKALEEVEQERAAKRQEERRRAEEGTRSEGALVGLLLPGLYQLRQGQTGRGSTYMSATFAGLAGAAYFGSQQSALAAEYSGIEEFVNLLMISGNSNSGGTLDLLLTLRLNELGTQANQAALGGVGSAGLFLTMYLVNAFDILIQTRSSEQALRLRWHPQHASLAFEVRF